MNFLKRLLSGGKNWKYLVLLNWNYLKHTNIHQRERKRQDCFFRFLEDLLQIYLRELEAL